MWAIAQTASTPTHSQFLATDSANSQRSNFAKNKDAELADALSVRV